MSVSANPASTRAPRAGRWRALKRVAAVASVVVLAFGTVFVDELVRGQAIDEELVVDLIVGVLLAVTAMVAALVVIWLSESRERLEQGHRVLAAARDADEDRHETAVLMGLARQAREMLGFERVAVIVADEDGRTCSIAAGSGLPEGLLGSSFEIASGVTGTVFANGASLAVPDPDKLQAPGERGPAQAAGASVPVVWSGRVSAVISGVASPDRPTLGEHDVDVLSHLAELGGLALEQATVRGRLERAAQAGVEALAAAVEARDGYTGEHSEQVVQLARQVGGRLGLDRLALEEVEIAARLHDVGKIGIPDAILRKPGPLDGHEWEIVRRHPGIGAEMLARVPELTGLAVLVRAEHERWDGRGYPDGLRGEEIPVASRIVFVCDAYHAMTSKRPYRSSLTREEAIRELQTNAGAQFDPATVEALVEVLSPS